MQVLREGKGELPGWHDPDEARKWVLENKSRELKDKTMSAKEEDSLTTWRAMPACVRKQSTSIVRSAPGWQLGSE